MTPCDNFKLFLLSPLQLYYFYAENSEVRLRINPCAFFNEKFKIEQVDQCSGNIKAFWSSKLSLGCLILICFITQQSLRMTNRIKTLTVLLFALLAIICASNSCSRNQIWRKTQCVACSTLPHTINQLDEKISAGDTCSCQTGYEWSGEQQQCFNTTNINQIHDSDGVQEYASRLLEFSCDATLGFVNYTSTYITIGNPQACINCRNILYGSGATINLVDCSCRSNFDFRSTSKTCYCYRLLDPSTQKCEACEVLGTDSTTYNGCTSCNLPYMKRGYHGCINCKKLANNGGDTSCCNAATGYTLSSYLGKCVCQNGWGIDSTGKCASCGTNTDCTGKKKTYFNNGYEAIHHTLVPNYDPTVGTAGGCKAGYIYKKNLVTNQILGCACSKAALYYLSGSTCTTCSSPPGSASKANCEDCSAASGFWAGPYECVYCKGDANSLGTATISGCDCKPKYYWNINTAKCECDFALGFIGAASACVDCSTLANTGTDMVEGACSCKSGYKWNPTTNTCNCDTQSPAVFSSDSQCVSCAIANMPGSSGLVGADGKSCLCSKGYYWNPGKGDCICDANQNYFVDTDGFCKQCSNVAMSIGLGSSQSCICKKGLQWNLATKSCVCPSGYVQMTAGCIKCSSATFSNGATSSDCSSCLNSKGFALYKGDCYFCPDQFLVNAVVTGGVCSCKEAGMIWYPERAGCGCDMSLNKMLYYNAGVYSCKSCNWVYTGAVSRCACPYQYQVYDAVTKTCTDCRNLPNSNYDSTAKVCNCNSGTWSYDTFPLSCVSQNFMNVGKGYYSSKTSSSTACSQAPNVNACNQCTTAGGYVWIINLNVCLKCSEVTDATGVAVENGCVCAAGKFFDPLKMTCVASTCAAGYTYSPNSGACDLCDPIKSVMVGGTCVSCAADSNSVGYAKTSSECACKSGNTWSNGACNNGNCDPLKSIWIGTLCFACPTTNKGTGVPNGSTKCGCSNSYNWVATLTGGSCQCPSDIAYIAPDTNCFFCPTDTVTVGTAAAAGNGCNCKKNYVWSAISKLCKCDNSVSGFTKSDGNCFVCLSTVDANFDGTVAVVGGKNVCGCKNSYEFTAIASGEGTCTCPSATSIIGSGGKCVKCSSDPKSNAGKLDGTAKCACAGGWVWSTTSNKCICDSTVSGFPLTNGNCFICASTVDPNFTGSDSTKCTCGNAFQFVSTAAGGSCQCPSPKVISNNKCTGCPQDTAPDGNGGCSCVNNFVWAADSSSCVCNKDVNGFVATGGKCFICASSDANPLFNGLNSLGTECLCDNGFVFSTSDNTCKCSSPKTLLTATKQCVTCPTAAQGGTGKANANGDACQCSNGKQWTPTQGCACKTTQVVLTSGACFTCGTSGTFTNAKVGNACTCSKADGFWNADDGLCDCGDGKAIVITGTTKICVTCDALVNSDGKADYKSCSCNPTSLTWSAVSKACVCQSTQYFAKGECKECTSDKFAKQLTNPKQKSECTCLNSALLWNTADELCRCKKSSDVIFMVANTPSCKTCGSAINANAVAISPTQCQCPSGLVWANNIGCVCQDSNAILLTKPSRCIVCDGTIYSTGPSADKRTCACMGKLKWTKTFTCGCLKTTEIVINSNDVYSCFQCKNASANTATPAIEGKKCTCSPATLTWYDTGMCGCSDINAMVWVGKPVNSCVTCDESINSVGKVSINSKTCTCMDPALTFNNGICDCGANSALIIQGISTVKCVNCKDANLYVKSKKNTNECDCVSKSLIWDNVEGYCRCSDTNNIIAGKSSKMVCKPCAGSYIKSGPPVDSTTCQCLIDDHTFIAQSSGAISCSCSVKNSITTYEPKCLYCADTKKALTVSECACAKTAFWDNAQQKCVTCTAISGAVASNGMSCKCSDRTKVWDVVKKQCIAPCTGSTCLDCTKITFATGEAPIPVEASTVVFAGGAAVKSLLNKTSTNYAQLSKYQCPCFTNYSWDKERLSCLSQLLITG